MMVTQTATEPLHLFAAGPGGGDRPGDDLYWLEVAIDFTGPHEKDMHLIFEHEKIKGTRVVRLMRDRGKEQDIGFVRVVNAPAPGVNVTLSRAPAKVTATLRQPDVMTGQCATVGQPYRVFDFIPDGGAADDANWWLDTDNGTVDRGVVIPNRPGPMTIGLTVQDIPTRTAYSVKKITPAQKRTELGTVNVSPDGCSVRLTMAGNGRKVEMTYSADHDTTEIVGEDGARVLIAKDRFAIWQPDSGYMILPPEVATQMSAQMVPIDPDELAVYGDTVEDRMVHLPLMFSELFSLEGAQTIADGAASAEAKMQRRAPQAARTPVACPDGGGGCVAFTAKAFGRPIADVIADDVGRPRRVILAGSAEEHAFDLSYGDFDIFPPPWGPVITGAK
jgi:hypothetical protein